MVLDTNILIAYLDGDPRVVRTVSEWRHDGRALFVSSITVAEVLALPSLTPKDIDAIREFLGSFIAAPLDNALAERAALLKRVYGLAQPFWFRQKGWARPA